MKNFILGAVQKSRTALSILALLFIMGIYAMITLPKATEPSVTFPGVGVSVVYEGVSPQDSERLLAKPLEAALRPIEGVDFIRSTSTTGYTFSTFSYSSSSQQLTTFHNWYYLYCKKVSKTHRH